MVINKKYEVLPGAISLSNGLYMSVYDVYNWNPHKFHKRIFGATNTTDFAARKWAEDELKTITEADIERA